MDKSISNQSGIEYSSRFKPLALGGGNETLTVLTV